MNQRQQKKKLKNALEILNTIEVLDSDCDSESVMNITVEDSVRNRGIVSMFCDVLEVPKRTFLNLLKVDGDDSDELALSMAFIYFTNPKVYETWYHTRYGFTLKRICTKGGAH